MPHWSADGNSQTVFGSILKGDRETSSWASTINVNYSKIASITRVSIALAATKVERKQEEIRVYMKLRLIKKISVVQPS